MDSSGSLVGREDEVGRLHRMVGGLVAGRGGVVWIEGEPGIGKSSLICAASAQAAGCQTYLATGDEFNQRLPLRALLDCLDAGAERELLAPAHQADGLPPGDPVPALVERLLALVDRLTAGAPVLLAFDDVQWADEASLLVLRRLARATAQMPLLLVVAGRPVPASAALVRLRRLLIDGGATAVALGPLPGDAVESLVGRLAGGPPGPALRRIAGQCGGNPLYLRELVDALVRDRHLRVGAGGVELADEVDPAGCSWTRAVAARLDFLSPPATRMLRTAALLGTPFPLADLSVVAETPATALVPLVEEAIGAGVLCEHGDGLAFRHALIRQALYQTTPAAARAAIHGQAAHALARSAAPVERVATHLLLVPELPGGWALDWLAEHATDLAYRAPQTAVDLLRQAAEQCADDPRQEMLQHGLANALLLLRRQEEAEEVARRARRLTRDPQRLIALTWIIAVALMRSQRYAETVPVLEEALAGPDLGASWRVRLRALRAQLLGSLGRGAEAADQAREALAEGERLHDRTAIGHALMTMYMRAGYQDSIGYLDRALDAIGDHPGHRDLRLSLLVERGGVLHTLGDYEASDKALREAMILAERQVGWRSATVRAMAGWCYVQRGRWDDAWTELRLAGEPCAPIERLVQLGAMTFVAVHREDRAAAASCLRAADQLPPLTGALRGAASYLWMARAAAAEQRGDLAGALEVLAGTTGADDGGNLYDRYMWLPELVRLALARSDRDLARAALAATELDAAGDPTPLRVWAARHAKAIFDRDPDALLSGIGDIPALGPLERGQGYEHAAVLLAEAGAVVPARAALTEAVRLYLDLGAAWDVRRADARLRQHGVRRGPRSVRRRPTSGWEALTATEQRVAALVAQGGSNPDIAAEMFLSRRTVQMHVSNILGKLGYASRIDIVREATRRAAAS
jgi:DNA-binding CsgD family transcriptional regulator/tetratricopeptide (TPR) repeat protein